MTGARTSLKLHNSSVRLMITVAAANRQYSPDAHDTSDAGTTRFLLATLNCKPYVLDAAFDPVRFKMLLWWPFGIENVHDVWGFQGHKT